MINYVLYNPKAANGRGEVKAKKVEPLVHGPIQYRNVIGLDMAAFFQTVNEEDKIILCGGDGTLNFFINQYDTDSLQRSIYYFPTGSGNDFMHDVQETDSTALIKLDDYLKRLPLVTINGITRRFINGIGYGLDGYCCAEGDRIRNGGNRKVNYTNIALKGLLYDYQPTNATVVVDGQQYEFHRVWLAPTMLGRYYGGGMQIAPTQQRLNPEHSVSLVVWHDVGKWGTLCRFMSVYKGQHLKYKKMLHIVSGHEVTVSFDHPTDLQVDGETVKAVTRYSVSSLILPSVH